MHTGVGLFAVALLVLGCWAWRISFTSNANWYELPLSQRQFTRDMGGKASVLLGTLYPNKRTDGTAN